jgi:hypothetical protein
VALDAAGAGERHRGRGRGLAAARAGQEQSGLDVERAVAGDVVVHEVGVLIGMPVVLMLETVPGIRLSWRRWM